MPWSSRESSRCAKVRRSQWVPFLPFILQDSRPSISHLLKSRESQRSIRSISLKSKRSLRYREQTRSSQGSLKPLRPRLCLLSETSTFPDQRRGWLIQNIPDSDFLSSLLTASPCVPLLNFLQNSKNSMLDRLNPFTSSAKKRLPLDESEDRQSSSLDTDGDSGDTRATSGESPVNFFLYLSGLSDGLPSALPLLVLLLSECKIRVQNQRDFALSVPARA